MESMSPFAGLCEEMYLLWSQCFLCTQIPQRNLNTQRERQGPDWMGPVPSHPPPHMSTQWGLRATLNQLVFSSWTSQPLDSQRVARAPWGHWAGPLAWVQLGVERAERGGVLDCHEPCYIYHQEDGAKSPKFQPSSFSIQESLTWK